MEVNEEHPVIEVARPNLANMTQAIVKPDFMGHFKHKQYMQGDGEPRRSLKQKAVGVIELDDFLAMREDIARLANQMNKMAMHQAQQMQHVQHISTCCELCSEGHTSDICPVNPEFIYYVGEKSSSRCGDLRNGRELVEVPKKKKEQSGLKEERVPKPVEVDERNKTKSEQISERVPPSFPQRLRKKNDDHIFHKFLDMLKQIQLNIPLVDMLREFPKYAKYIKDIVANKRRLTEFESVALTEEYTYRIQHKLPQKLKDPGSFTIPVRIGEIDVGRSLCDLDASINLMPLSVFK
nr:uncharacterized protein LOC104097288 [Nicotiana tomentosiformis]